MLKKPGASTPQMDAQVVHVRLLIENGTLEPQLGKQRLTNGA